MGGIVAYSWVGHRTWIRSVKHRNSRRHRGKVLFVLGPMEFARACGDTVPDDALRSPLISLLEDVEVPRISAEGKRIVDDTGRQASRITAPGRTEPPTIFAPGQPHHRVDFSRTAGSTPDPQTGRPQRLLHPLLSAGMVEHHHLHVEVVRFAEAFNGGLFVSMVAGV